MVDIASLQHNRFVGNFPLLPRSPPPPFDQNKISKSDSQILLDMKDGARFG